MADLRILTADLRIWVADLMHRGDSRRGDGGLEGRSKAGPHAGREDREGRERVPREKGAEKGNRLPKEEIRNEDDEDDEDDD